MFYLRGPLTSANCKDINKSNTSLDTTSLFYCFHLEERCEGDQHYQEQGGGDEGGGGGGAEKADTSTADISNTDTLSNTIRVEEQDDREETERWRSGMDCPF